MKSTITLLLIAITTLAFGQNSSVSLDYKATYSIGENELEIYFDKTGNIFYVDDFPDYVKIEIADVKKGILDFNRNSVVIELDMDEVTMFMDTDFAALADLAGNGGFQEQLSEDGALTMKALRKEKSHDHGSVNCSEYEIYPDEEPDSVLRICIDENMPFSCGNLLTQIVKLVDPNTTLTSEIPSGVLTGVFNDDGDFDLKLESIEAIPKKVEYNLSIGLTNN